MKETQDNIHKAHKRPMYAVHLIHGIRPQNLSYHVLFIHLNWLQYATTLLPCSLFDVLMDPSLSNSYMVELEFLDLAL